MGVARIRGHGVATTRTERAATGEPEYEPPEAGNGERDRQEDHGRAVGEASRTRAVGFGLLHQVNDPGVGRRRRRAECDDLHRLPDDARAAANLVARGMERRQGLSRQGSFVEHCALAQERAVDRDDLAREDAQTVAGAHIGRRHVDQPIPLMAMGDGRGTFDERGQLAPGAPECALFEQLAAREHERDDEACLELSQQQRPRDREQRDHIGAQLPAQHAPHDRHGERNDDRDQDGGPENVCGVAMAGNAQHESHRQGQTDGHGNDDGTHGTILRAHAPAGIGTCRRSGA